MQGYVTLQGYATLGESDTIHIFSEDGILCEESYIEIGSLHRIKGSIAGYGDRFCKKCDEEFKKLNKSTASLVGTVTYLGDIPPDGFTDEIEGEE
jgi:hypothetical protein